MDCGFINYMGYRYSTISDIIEDLKRNGRPLDTATQAQICSNHGIDIRELESDERARIFTEVYGG